VRIPRDSGLEPLVIASIKRYRRHALVLRLAAAVPLMAGVVIALAICLAKLSGDSTIPESSAGSWVVLGVITVALFFMFILLGKEKVPVVQSPQGLTLDTFENALEGVSMAVGLEPPRLLVLDLPTANSISFFYNNKPAVGVTIEALQASLPRPIAEAMMAHEIAHVLLGDVVAGQNKRRWRLIGLSFTGAMVLPFFCLALAFGFGVWLYLGLFGWIAFTFLTTWVLGRLVLSQNDLLADSVAAKITNDPGSLKEAVRLLGRMFLSDEKTFDPGGPYPTLFFVYENRLQGDLPEMPDISPERIANLEAIERGHWPAFER
jgi:Zn-dependent protease with chaperone function